MMPPGHIAATWAAATILQRKKPNLANLDYRGLAVGSMLPDLLDKPLAVLVFTDSKTSQLVAHSVLFHLLILIYSLLFWRAGLPYVLAFNGHLLCDRMWRHTESFWWPLFGWNVFWQFKPMNTPEEMLDVYLDMIVRYPRVWIIELVALLILGGYALRYRLFRGSHLKFFFLTGKFSTLRESSSNV